MATGLSTGLRLRWLGILAALGPSAASTQSLLRGPTCGHCDIVVTKVATIGGDVKTHAAAALSQTNIIERDSKGRFYVAPWVAPGEIKVFDDKGRFLRVIGRQGNGPLEFQMIRDLEFTRGDTLHVFDIALNRHTVISPEGKLVGTRTIAFGTFSQDAAVLFDGGRVGINSLIRSRSLVGLPLHIFEPDGRHVKSFGSVDGAFRSDAAVNSFRRISRGTDNTMWSMNWNRYLLEQWDIRGNRIAWFQRDVDWFKPWVIPTTPSASQPTQPTSMAIRQDKNGRLWIMIQVPDRQQHTQLRMKRVGPETAPVWEDAEKAFDTMVDVIDARNGALLVSKRLPQFIMKMSDDDHFVAYRETSEGEPVFDIWRVRFTQTTSTKR